MVRHAHSDKPGIVAGSLLLQIVNHLCGTHLISPPEVALEQPAAEALDMADIRGQGETRMALEVTAAGEHCRPEPARPHCRYEKIVRAGLNRISRVALMLADLD